MNRRVWLAVLLVFPLYFAQATEEKKEESETILSFGFVREVLQPLGVPLVCGFHQIRESIFLNTKVKGASGCEAVGNFFLAPSRYLFGGKNIEWKQASEATCKTAPSFHYHKLHWLKTLLAITFLPITEPLGASFKGLAYLSPEVKHRHTQIRNQLNHPPLVPHDEEYQKAGLPPLYSEHSIPCLHHKRPSRLARKQALELTALKETIQLLEQHKIVYWLDCGSALGAYRYGGIIPWDWDIDIAILLPDHENVKSILSQLDPELYQIQDWSSYSLPNTFLKLLVKKTKNFIDIYHYQLDPEKKELAYLYTYRDTPIPLSWKLDELKCTKPVKYEDVFPLKQASFDGLTVWVPNNIVTFLQSKYGENLEPSNVWSEETRTYQKVLDHPYWKN